SKTVRERLINIRGWRKRGDEDWRKNADAHKMSPEEVKRAGVEESKGPSGHNKLGGMRRRLPYSPKTMALGGVLIVATVGYFTLYAKKKREARDQDVGRVTTSGTQSEDSRPGK
ncbi:unnamed protein product, partial [Ilex paraguariensis]